MTSRAFTDEDLAEHLARTSRTFALAIPLLEAPLARQVGLAYLLFRIADTLEDAPLWGRDRRAAALASFARWLDDRSEVAWVLAIKEAPPSTDDGCLALLARASDVLCAAEAETSIAGALLAHTRRTALGMAEFVARQDTAGVIVLADLEDLRRYAYAVAGIVGELLTALFAANEPALAGPEVRARLDAEAVLFGEALQLVNILKDAPADAREGRAYLPRGVDRSTVVDLARSDLVHAERYVEVLAEAGGAARTVAFCELPLRLAIATLDRLDAGAAKLTREEVYRIFADVTARRGPRSPA